MSLKLKVKIKNILYIIDILILICQILLLGLIICFSIIADNFSIKNVIEIIFLTFSLIFCLTAFIKNIINDYRIYYSISSIFKFFSYSFLVIAYILIKQGNIILNFNNIIQKFYYFTGLIGIILIIINIYIEFLISSPEIKAE